MKVYTIKKILSKKLIFNGLLGVDIAEKIKPHECEKLPWRWVVERTFAWLNHSRRRSKDYERGLPSLSAFF